MAGLVPVWAVEWNEIESNGNIKNVSMPNVQLIASGFNLGYYRNTNK